MSAELLAARARQIGAEGGFHPAPDGVVASPCVSVCRMADDGSHCLGCFRTRTEIRQWSEADATQRRAIWRALLRRAGLPPLAGPG